MDVIRYHSLYPWHTGGDYHEFMNGDEDQETLKHILDFNKFDLYSKEDAVDISDDVKAYYDNLLDQYFDGELLW
jgi:inositol oxygenase